MYVNYFVTIVIGLGLVSLLFSIQIYLSFFAIAFAITCLYEHAYVQRKGVCVY